MKNCCKTSKKDKKCIRKKDRKTLKLPRKFSKKKCTKEKVKIHTLFMSINFVCSLNKHINGICIGAK